MVAVGTAVSLVALGLWAKGSMAVPEPDRGWVHGLVAAAVQALPVGPRLGAVGWEHSRPLQALERITQAAAVGRVVPLMRTASVATAAAAMGMIREEQQHQELHIPAAVAVVPAARAPGLRAVLVSSSFGMSFFHIQVPC